MTSPRAFERTTTEERNIEMSTAVTESSFEQEVLESDKPVIVDFWAEWCGPCHAVSPVLDKIVEERESDLKLVKVNLDEEPSLAQKYGIVSIPTIILSREGELDAAAIGAQPKSALEKSLGLTENGAAAWASACPFSGCGSGEAARAAGSGARLSTRMP